jgi:hypothetical protein
MPSKESILKKRLKDAIAHMMDAVEVRHSLMMDEDAPPHIRLKAAEGILKEMAPGGAIFDWIESQDLPKASSIGDLHEVAKKMNDAQLARLIAIIQEAA